MSVALRHGHRGRPVVKVTLASALRRHRRRPTEGLPVSDFPRYRDPRHGESLLLRNTTDVKPPRRAHCRQNDEHPGRCNITKLSSVSPDALHITIQYYRRWYRGLLSVIIESPWYLVGKLSKILSVIIGLSPLPIFDRPEIIFQVKFYLLIVFTKIVKYSGSQFYR